MSSSFRFSFDSNGILDERVHVDGRNGSEGGAGPVDDAVLDVGVALAPELEPGSQNRVKVTPRGTESWKVK